MGKGERTISNAEVSLPLSQGKFTLFEGFLCPIPHTPWLGLGNPQINPNLTTDVLREVLKAGAKELSAEDIDLLLEFAYPAAAEIAAKNG